MIRKIKKEVGCSFKENIQYMDQTLPVEKSFDIIFLLQQKIFRRMRKLFRNRRFLM